MQLQQNYHMFPSVAREDPIKDKIKQKQWDQRFSAKTGIPDYSPLKDKHTKSYRKIITNKKEEGDIDNRSKKATYFQKRMQLVEQLNELHKPNAKLIEEYQQIAGKYKLPNFYIYYTLLPLLSPSESITEYLFREKKETKEQASHFHRMSTAVRARQECLQRLRKTLGDTNESKLQSVRQELKEEVQHLRMLTENAIDQIKRWRDSLGKIQERAIFYTDAQQNYLVKILNDNKFIFSSKLATALAFAEKNDPFLLIPVKRGEGRQASMFSDIVKLNKDFSHYQKYMEYLASQKAYQLAINSPVKQSQTYKNPVVEKIYKSTQPKPVESITFKQGEEDQNYKKMELLKMRQDRLKKNDEKIKTIKSIYESYGKKMDDRPEKHYISERKMPETDNQDRRGRKKRSQSIKITKNDTSDVEFELLVKLKMQADKTQKRKTPLKKMIQSKSAVKLPKTQDKMIQSLRDIQTTLRSKLQVIQQQQKNQMANASQLSATQQRFNRKNNQQIVKQLKAEILSKIEKEASEKQRLKKIKRQQEERALQQIKAKLKKQMEEKLQQKKKQKMLEREQLEKKLKQEEDRLNSQRQLQLQLQIKLTKEKELRELEKIKRQALQREKKFKDQLEKQQNLRKQGEEAMMRERRQKQKLMQQLRKKELKQQIEDEIRKQIKGTQNQKSKSMQFGQQELIRTQKQFELSKQIESLKMKQGVEIQQLKKQNQLRQRMLRLKKDEQQLKRKEIEHLMRSVVQQQKEQIQQDAIKQRIQLQERMRSNVKEKMLQQYRNQKEVQIQQIKNQRQKQLEEEVYREKIRDKIQRQMRIDAIQRTKKDLQEREGKRYEVRSKLQQVKNRFDKEVVMDKGKIQEQVKKQMIQKVIFDKQAEKQAAKYDLRRQFQKQLMASAVPQIYENKDSFLIKNTNYFEGDIHLNSKINELKPTNQKPTNQSPLKKNEKSQVKELINTMTMQQLQVYEKQKQKVSEMKQQKVVEIAKIPYQEEGFEKLNIQKSKKEEQGFDVRVIKMTEPIKKQEKNKQKNKSKRKKKKQSSSSEVDSQQEIKHKKHMKKHKKQKKQYYQEQSQQSQVQKKHKKRSKKRKQQSEQDSSQSSEEKNKRKIVLKKSQINQFKSEEDRKSKLSKASPKKEPTNIIDKQATGKAKVYFDAQNKPNLNQIQPITMKPQKVSNTSQKFKISLEAIPQAEFDQYLQVHFSSVSQLQIAIQMHDRQQLFRKLVGQLTFCLLVAQFQGRVVGQALAFHDRNRSQIRKFTLIHLATYRDDDLKDFVLSVTNFIFRKDPCDEIDFHYKFDQGNEDQLTFSQTFNKWFDKYGSVFQKKVNETNYQRKYVFKRQFNQKCEVVLGGVNKNIFRNLFSVYCGVLMSDTQLIQFKEELVDTLAPQHQICYALMAAQLFRTYLSPDEAQTLKTKVKEFVKLKQMLILVVSMQKKKLKLDQIKLYQYKNLIELNMRLMSQGKQIIRYCKEASAQTNRIYYAQLNHAFNLPFHFQTTSLPVQANHQQIRQISYFRLSPLPPFKLHIIKSSLYNAQMNILPTENSKYKIFVINAQQYNEIKQSSSIDLFMYVRLFLKNVKSHNVAVWKYVWFPEMVDKGAWNLREFKSFLNKDFYTHDTINISYRQFLPGALIIEPQHRDLVITPPFIVGVMSMNLEQVSEGSPLYARVIEVNALKTLEIEKN